MAGWRDPAELEPPVKPDGKHHDFRRLNGLLRAPHDALGDRGHDRPVWHCSVRAAPGDRMLSDAEWAKVAADVMHRTGLSPHGQAEDAVRWVAIRHAADHIHIVAMLARQDGGKAFVYRDFYQVADACHAAEQHYGLRRTPASDSTAGRHPTRAETEKAARQGHAEPARVTLRRLVAEIAASTGSESEFFARLSESRMLFRVRHSTRNPEEVTGYAVALPGNTGQDGQPVWYGGGRLAADLTLPKLRARWSPDRSAPSSRVGPREWLSPQERAAVWDQAISTAESASAAIRANPLAAGDIAWAAGDMLRACSAVLGNQHLRLAADAYDRAAREQYARISPPSPDGYALRTAARAIHAIGFTVRDRQARRGIRIIELIVQLAALAEAVAWLRETQARLAQATAAHNAARQMRAANLAPAPASPSPEKAPQPGQASTPRVPRGAQLDFPAGPLSAATGTRPGRPPSARPPRQTPQPRRRGPAP